METHQPRFFHTYRNVVAIVTTQFLRATASSSYHTFWSLYLLELGASVTQIGLLSLISGCIVICLQLPIGHMVDTHGRKRIMIALGYLEAAGMLLNSFANVWYWTIPGNILVGVGGILQSITIVAITDGIPPRKMGRVLSARLFSMSLPGLFMPAAIGSFVDAVGIVTGVKTGLVFASVLSAVSATGNALLLRESSVRSKNNVKKSLSPSTLLGPLRSNHSLQLLTLEGLAHFICGSFMGTFSPIYMVKTIGISNTEYGLINSIARVVGLLLRLPQGYIVDRVGNRRLILISTAFRPVLLPLFVISRSFLQFTVLQSLYVILENDIEATARQAYISSIVSESEKGTAMLSSFAIGNIATQGSPYANGLLWDAVGPVNSFYINAAVYLIIGLPLLVKLRGETTREPNESLGQSSIQGESVDKGRAPDQ